VELGAAHAWQAHVHDEAIRLARMGRVQEFLRRGGKPDLETDGPDQALERFAYRKIVVDHGNERRHRCSFGNSIAIIERQGEGDL